MSRHLLLIALFFSLQTASAQDANPVFVDVSGSDSQICAIDTEGGLVCNQGIYGTRLVEPDNLPALKAVTVAYQHACALTVEGQAVCWGDNDFGQLDAPATVFKSVDSGYLHTCGLTEAGDIECWGLNDTGESSLTTDPFAGEGPAEPAKIIDLAVTGTATCGLDTTGNIPCWGTETGSFRPQSTDPSAARDLEVIDAAVAYKQGGSFSRCGLLIDGTVDCLNGSFNFADRYSQLASFFWLMCGLTRDGILDCQVDAFDTRNHQATFEQIDAINAGEPLVAISSGARLCGLTASGAAKCILPYPRQESSDAIVPGNEVPPLPAPKNLQAAIYSDTTLELLWDRGDSNAWTISVAEIYRNGELLASTTGLTSYLDDTLEAGAAYEYKVRYVSFKGAPGKFSNSVMINNTPGMTPGQPPAGSYTTPTRPYEPADAVALVYGQDLLELQWSRVTDASIGYEIRRDGAFIGYTTGISYVDSQFNANSNYVYEILAVNSAGDILGVTLIKP